MDQNNKNFALPDAAIGENKMDIVEHQMITSNNPLITDHPVALWLKQSLRNILGKRPLQEEVLEKVVNQALADDNLLGVLLFGSLASQTHTWKSDIDLIFIYEAHEPESGLVNFYETGIEVQYFFATLETLVENVQAVPYLLHIFCDAKILFDRFGSVAPVVSQIEDYFDVHPEIKEEWAQLKENHQVEKKGPACAQTTILQRWDELEDKYSGGARKRTFFRI
jgi:predicted nucleotidyltransferase